jgi:hypothetical protein
MRENRPSHILTNEIGNFMTVLLQPVAWLEDQFFIMSYIKRDDRLADLLFSKRNSSED